MNCVGQAVTESTGNNSRVKFIDCKMVGTTNYVGWFMKGEYRNCLIVGKFGAGNARAGVTDINQPDKKAEFYRCVFSDDTRLSPTGIVAQGIMGMASEAIMRVRYEECEWHTYNTSYMFGYTSNDPQSIIEVIGGKWVIHEGSTLTGTNLVQYYSSRLKNFEFIDERSVATELDITVAKDYKSPWKNVSFKSATGKFRGSWTGAILPTDKKRYVLNDITSISDANRDDFSPVWAVRLVKGDYNNQQTRDNLHTVTTKIIGSSAVSSIPTDSLHNPFGISDRVINNSPTDTSWTESVCTKAGYTCSTAWGASTDYFLNAYINANGNVYRATIAGTSSTIAPSHTSGDMVDGTVTWMYVGALAIFRTIGVKGTAVADNNYSLTSTPTIEELVSALAKVQSELRSLKSSVKTAGYIL